jgi:CheY-like chemotaxis protein
LVPSIESSLLSIGHEYDWVTSQLEAQKRFSEGEYDSVLLDLQIPATAFRGGADKETCCRKSRSSKGLGGSP